MKNSITKIFLVGLFSTATVAYAYANSTPAKTPGAAKKVGNVEKTESPNGKKTVKRTLQLNKEFVPESLKKEKPPAANLPVPTLPAGTDTNIVVNERMERQMEALIARIDQMLDLQKDSLLGNSGSRSMSPIYNETNDQNERISVQALEQIVARVLNGQRIPGDHGDVLKGHIEQIQEDYYLDKLDELGEDPVSESYTAEDKAMDVGARENGKIAIAANAIAKKKYSEVHSGMQRLTGLIEMIDRTPDLKSSIDLLSRIVAEDIQMRNQNMRLQAMNLMLTSSQFIQVTSGRLHQKETLKF